MMIKTGCFKSYIVKYPAHLFDSVLPEISAHSLHHVESWQHHQSGLELLQAGHEGLQSAHLPIRHIVREDEAIGLRGLARSPLLPLIYINARADFSCSLFNKTIIMLIAHCTHNKVQRKRFLWETLLLSLVATFYFYSHAHKERGIYPDLPCTQGWGETHQSPEVIAVELLSVHPAIHAALAQLGHTIEPTGGKKCFTQWAMSYSTNRNVQT